MNGRILTGRRVVGALLVDGRRVVVAGTDAEVRRERPTGTETHDLAGRLVVPGLVDAHVHLRTSILARTGVDLSECRSVAEVVERFRNRLAMPGSGPLVGYGWDESRFPTPSYPHRRELDALASDRPIVAYRHCLHVAVTSSAGLDALGLDDRSPDPGGGRLGRERGELDGRLFEAALRPLGRIEARAFAAQAVALSDWLKLAASYGLTTLAPMAVDHSDLGIVEEVRTRGPLPVRLRAYGRWDAGPWLPAAVPVGEAADVRLIGVKTYLDGALGPRTAWLTDEYADDPGNRGGPSAGADTLDSHLETARSSGLQLAVHTIGDAALQRALRTFRGSADPLAPRIEHASITPPDLLRQLAEIRPALVVQPMFRQSDRWLRERLGEVRARWTYALRSLYDLGLPMAGSSDAPVESIDPWTGMAAACAPRHGAPPGEELDAPEALSLYTSAAGRVLGEPGIGALEPGSFGDLVVLDAVELSPAIAVGSASVQSTFREGRLTFERAPNLGQP